MRRLLAGAVAVGLAASGLLVSLTGSHGVHVEPEVNFALPSKAAGCGGATVLDGGATRVPIRVSTVDGQVDEMVNVCIAGHGPYPFVVDSGAGASTIDAGLADRLHLAHAGPTSGFSGVGCTGAARPVAVPHWSVSGVTLAAQSLTAATLPGVGKRGEPVGLLGSDVLSSFGAVRIDFRAQTLTFAGPQGAEPTKTSEVSGPTGLVPTSVLSGGGPGTVVPLRVELAPGDTAMSVRLRFGRGPVRAFVVDTGSSQSVVASAVAKSEKLAHTTLAERQATVCSTITVPLVHSGPWSIPGVTLHPQLIGSTDFGTIGAGGLVGLLGSDQLIRYGWVVFDYVGGQMILG